MFITNRKILTDDEAFELKTEIVKKYFTGELNFASALKVVILIITELCRQMQNAHALGHGNGYEPIQFVDATVASLGVIRQMLVDGKDLDG